jgi:5-methylcytosine-specific restriction protein A
MKNPPWSRDELIVTLDFYLKHSPSIPDKKSKDISSLSDLLNQLQVKMDGVGCYDKFY